MIKLVVSAHRAHANIVFTPSTRESFAAQLTTFSTGKARSNSPYDNTRPADLLDRMIRHRIREYENDGGKWM